MGVTGAGKSAVAQWLAAELDLELAEGDDFHPDANVAKMSAGQRGAMSRFQNGSASFPLIGDIAGAAASVSWGCSGATSEVGDGSELGGATMPADTEAAC